MNRQKQLKHTEACLGPKTTDECHDRIRDCDFLVYRRKPSGMYTEEDLVPQLIFNFEFSRGRGITCASLVIGKDDLPAILEEIADTIPEMVGVFLDCAALASKKNLQALDQARSGKKEEG